MAVAAIRLVLRVGGEAFQPDDQGIEQELDDDFSARFEVVCADKEQVQRLFEMVRVMVKGAVEAGGR